MNKKLIKNFLITLLFFVMLLGVIAKNTIAAPSLGQGKWISGQWDSNIYTTDSTSDGIIVRRLINHNNYNEKITAFCAEHRVNSPTGITKPVDIFIPRDPIIKRACKIAYFGWYAKYGDYVVDGSILASGMKQRLLDYCFTQQYIWETLGQSNATFRVQNLQTQYLQFKNEINQKITNMETRPSFEDSTIQIDVGDTKVITDSNNVLKNYHSIDNTVEGIRIIHNHGENTLKIIVDNNCNKDNYSLTDEIMKSWGMIKDDTENQNTTVYFSFEDGVQDQLYSLNYNDPVAMSFNLKILAHGNLEISKTNQIGDLVDGSKVRVKSNDGYNNLVLVENGKIKLENLKIGMYEVYEEKAPNGYLIDTQKYRVEVKPNETSRIIIVNKEPTGIINIKKIDSELGTKPQGDGKLIGAQYELIADETIYNKARTKKFYSKGDIVATRSTDKNGKMDDIYNLPLGKYMVKEKIASQGYLVDTKEYKVDLRYKDQNTSTICKQITSEENIKKMQVHIFKSGIEEYSGEVRGLAGTEFTIKLNSDVERAIQQGYLYQEIWQGIDENGNIVNVNANRVEEAQEIAPTYEKITTDEEGNAYTQNQLPFGQYLVKETITPEDYISANDFTFSITNDETEIVEIAKKTKHIVINNQPLESYVRVVKIDAITEKKITLNSATFEIKAAEDIYNRGNGEIIYRKGDTIIQKVGDKKYNSFTTNSNNLIVPVDSFGNSQEELGTFTTPLKLQKGCYEIIEIVAPQGFIKLQEPINFEIKGIRNYDCDSDGDYIIEVVIENDQPFGRLVIDKDIKFRENVDKSIIEIGDLEDIEFILIAKEDIIDVSDGSILYQKGEKVREFNLARPQLRGIKRGIGYLPIGVYEVYESRTWDGLVLDNTRYEVKFTQEDQSTEEYEIFKEIVNNTTIVEFSKTDITGENELVGANLTVLKVEDDNNSYSVIDSWTSTEKPHTIEGLTVGASYILREEIAPKGYVKANEIRFTIENTKEIQHINMIDKIVEFTKVDSITGDIIEGTELEVRDLENNIIDNWISTKEPHIIEGLEENKTYILVEKNAPYGYYIAETITFKVTDDKDTQKIIMKDNPILCSIKVEKIDKETKEHIKSNKFQFGLFKDENCTKLITKVGANEYEGSALFKDLRYGIYYIKEIKAPLGYSLSKQVVKIEINDKGIFADGIQLEGADNIYGFEYYNSLLPVIQTGNEISYIFLLSVIGISIIGIIISIVLLKKKKK